MSKVIRLKDSTYERLARLGTWKDTADNIICRLLDEFSSNEEVLD